MGEGEPSAARVRIQPPRKHDTDRSGYGISRRTGEGQGEGKRRERTAPKSKGSRVTTHLKCRVPDFRDGTEVPLSVRGVACKAHNLMNHPTGCATSSAGF